MAKIRDFKLGSDGSYQLVRVCEKRKSNTQDQPKDITLSLGNFLPFDDLNTQTLNVSNMLGMKLPKFTLRSGQVYNAFDGKRLIYEVGCNTVIYTLINAKGGESFRFFLQPLDGFVFDSTSRSIAAKVVNATAPIKTLVKYEMYFLLGLISTASTATLILVIGTDITVSGIIAKSKMDAAKKFTEDLLAEKKAIAEYAPVLHLKIEEFFLSQTKVKWKTFGSQLPKTIIKDEKTQAQLAGVLAGKAAISPKAFNVWTAVFAILSTAVIKSVTKSPEAYLNTIDQKYRPILDDLRSVDFDNISAGSKAVAKFRTLIEESGVKISNEEALAIIKEVSTNSVKLETSLKNVHKSFNEFYRSVKDN